MSLNGNQISQWIAQFGFPIVAYLLVYWDLRKKIEKLTEAVNELAIRLAGQKTGTSL